MLLAPLLLANSQEQTLCYNLKWTTPAGKELRKSFNAITSFPATHPKVTGRDQNGKFLKTCGTVPAFSAIPTTSSWPWQNRGYGSNWKTDDSCKTLSGAEVFYGYHAPYGSSANAGDRGYKAGALLAYFIIDDSLNSYLVLTADQPRRGGLDLHRANISLAGRNLDGKDVQLVVVDDETDPHSWDPATAHGTFEWEWYPCCTDGAVLGPFPCAARNYRKIRRKFGAILADAILRTTSPLRYTNYSIELAFDAARSYGIDRAYIMDFNYTTGDVDYFELPAWGEYDDPASTMNSIDSGRAMNSIEITGSLCTEYCRAISSAQLWRNSALFGAIR